MIEHDNDAGPNDQRTQMTTTDQQQGTEPGPNDVTDERAQMLANHAIYVQGGYSDAERERARAEAQLASSPGSIDWAKMKGEVVEAIMARLVAGPTTPPVAVSEPVTEPTEPAPSPTPTPVPTPEPAPAAEAAPARPEGDPSRRDVSAVLASIDQGEALRDRIKTLTADLKVHEDNIKAVLGDATVGVDAKGSVLVRYPHRNRSGLSKDKVKAKLSAADYAECETVTPYRTLLYGEG